MNRRTEWAHRAPVVVSAALVGAAGRLRRAALAGGGGRHADDRRVLAAPSSRTTTPTAPATSRRPPPSRRSTAASAGSAWRPSASPTLAPTPPSARPTTPTRRRLHDDGHRRHVGADGHGQPLPGHGRWRHAAGGLPVRSPRRRLRHQRPVRRRRCDGIDIGVLQPTSYCQDDPQMAVSCFVFDDQIVGPNAGWRPCRAGVRRLGRRPPSPRTRRRRPDRLHLGPGLAGQSGTLFVGAFLKRHAGFGPGGPGAIYRIERGADSTSGRATTLFTFVDLGVAAGRARPAPGGHRLLPRHPDLRASWARAASATSSSAATAPRCYAVGLASRQLYRIPIGNPPTPGPVSARSRARPGHRSDGLRRRPGDPGRSAEPQRAAVRPRHHHGLLYLGEVCSPSRRSRPPTCGPSSVVRRHHVDRC